MTEQLTVINGWRGWLLGAETRAAVAGLAREVEALRNRPLEDTGVSHDAFRMVQDELRAVRAQLTESEEKRAGLLRKLAEAQEATETERGRGNALAADAAAMEGQLKDATHATEIERTKAVLLAKQVTDLTVEVELLREEAVVLRTRTEGDDLHLARLEVAELTKRLQAEQIAHGRAQQNVGRLWNFIALRNKPPTATNIRDMLAELSQPKSKSKKL